MVVQIAQIRIRRSDRAEDINPHLDSGEFALALDNGRLVIGGSGTYTPVRNVFPYGNIEVVTENSIEFLDGEFDMQMRDVQRAFSKAADIAAGGAGATFTPLVFEQSGRPVVVTTTQAGLGAARISYFVLDGSRPLRAGALNLVYDDSTQPPMLSDEFVARPSIGGGAPRYADIAFRPMVDPINREIGIEVINSTNRPISVFFRMERPKLDGKSQGEPGYFSPDTGTIAGTVVAGVASVAGRGVNGVTVVGGPITTTGTLSIGLTVSGVIAGTYTNATLIIDSFGRVVSASNGFSNVVLSQNVASLAARLSIAEANLNTERNVRSLAISTLAMANASIVGRLVATEVTLGSFQTAQLSTNGSLSSRLVTLTNRVASVEATLGSITTATSNNNAALVGQMTTLTVRVAAVASDIVAEQTARIALSGSLTSTVNILANQVNDIQNGLQNEQAARIVEDTNLNTRLASIRDRLIIAENRITAESVTRATADAGIINQIATITPALGTASAAFTTLVGQVAAFGTLWGAVIGSNNTLTGFRTNDGSQAVTLVNVRPDTFQLVPSSGAPVTPFVTQGSIISVNTSMIRSLTAANIVQNAVSEVASAIGMQTDLVAPGGVWVEAVSLSFDCTSGARRVLHVTYSFADEFNGMVNGGWGISQLRPTSILTRVRANRSDAEIIGQFEHTMPGAGPVQVSMSFEESRVRDGATVFTIEHLWTADLFMRPGVTAKRTTLIITEMRR